MPDAVILPTIRMKQVGGSSLRLYLSWMLDWCWPSIGVGMTEKFIRLTNILQAVNGVRYHIGDFLKHHMARWLEAQVKTQSFVPHGLIYNLGDPGQVCSSWDILPGVQGKHTMDLHNTNCTLNITHCPCTVHTAPTHYTLHPAQSTLQLPITNCILNSRPCPKAPLVMKQLLPPIFLLNFSPWFNFFCLKFFLIFFSTPGNFWP